MAVIKCKMCGGDLSIIEGATVAVCEYCGTKQTLPKVDDQQRAAAFDRGNHFRRLGEFDKALTVYERIVQEDENDAEAHWCCALCRFGIEYVKDPASGAYLPTCHRASFDNFLEDVDYKAALAHADGVARRQYQQDGERIAAVQRGILTTVQKEEPFDVFICYKESDENGGRTVDSTLAQEIYYQLTEQGRRVFFARITLEDKAGQEYEPYIFAALHSAKVMVVVGTRPEHLNAVWVRNEWSRYLALMRQDRKRLLIPCYRDMDPYDLPEQLSVLQSYDMSKIGFIQDLIRGVAKVLDTGKPKPTTVVKESVVVQGEGGSTLAALLKRGNMALEDGEWVRADEFFEQVLNMDAECATAYFGQTLAARRCSNQKQFIKLESIVDTSAKGKKITACPKNEEYIAQAVKDYQIPPFLTEEAIRTEFEKFDRSYESMEDARRQEFQHKQQVLTKDKLFNKAVRYAKDGQIVQIQREILDTYQARIAEGKKLDQKQETKIVQGYTEFLKKTTQEIEKLHNSVLEKLSSEYQVCCAAMDVADSEIAYRNCAKRFRKICGYQDSEQRMTQCEEAAAEIKQEEEQLKREKEQRKQEEERLRMERNARRNRLILISIAGVTALVLAVWLLITKVIIPGNHYKEAESLLAAGNKAGAALAFYEIGNYRDAWERSMALWGEIVQQNTIATGSSHTVGLKVDGTVVAVGNNEDGQCDVDCWTDIMAVAAGFGHTVGLKVDGTVAAVGYNQFGQCDVDCWTDIMAVAAGDNHTVGLKADGTVVAVGYNEYGQCDVNNWTDIVAVTADDYHTVGLKADGTVVAVGNNKYGECDVDGWTDIMAVAAGLGHTVGLKVDGTVVATKYTGDRDYYYGQCEVSGWTDIVTIAAEFGRTVGLKADGTVVAVGNNKYGECDVDGWTDIVAVAAGAIHTVGLRADGTVVAVGWNQYGQCDVSGWSGIKTPR